ncbi:MAG: hypothetical protein E6J62_15800 [Deltaproteobacteria bacterium]|nr:MAG: hypothetical protein E6J62_15800 [Deltaproteobacteria bacterium]TMB29721.1 MAG: hypothetical protein E6J61_14625 [Deltaproteobacteria bacterium]
MRRTALAFGILLCACHPTIDFDLTQSATGTIPRVPPPLPIPPGPVTLTLPIPQLQNINSSNLQGFPSSQTAKDHIQSARAKKITLTVTSPAGRDLSFLTDVTLTISAPGQPTKQFAHLSPFPAATSADLQLDDVDLAPYLKADAFSITPTVTGTPQRQDVAIKADLDLGVTASLF